jgi:hypothetical protein
VGGCAGSSWMLRHAWPRSAPSLRASATVTAMRRVRLGITRMGSRKAFRFTRDTYNSASLASISGRALNRFEYGSMRKTRRREHPLVAARRSGSPDRAGGR